MHLTKNSYLNLPGYEIIRSFDHPDKTAHGGTALLISNKIEHLPHSTTRTVNFQAASTSKKINSFSLSISSGYFLP